VSEVAAAERWFASKGWTPLEFQRDVWRAYLRGESGLVHAATGTGKTLAAWWGPLLEWLAHEMSGASQATHRARGTRRAATAPLRVLWITPLRALAADTLESLTAPVHDLGIPWSLESRTGDTSATVRARQSRKLPTALVTTPESFTLLLTRADVRELFGDLRAVIVDEWHELMGTKRGVQTELALARIRTLAPTARIWGLSATIGNLSDARHSLLGLGPTAKQGPIVRGAEGKPVVVDALIPPVAERFPWAGHLGTQLVPQVVDVIEGARSTIVFTNTRSQTEIWYQAILAERPDWADDRAAPWLARSEDARLGGERDARRHAALRRRDLLARSRCGLHASRSCVADRQPEGRRAAAAARRAQRPPAR